MFGGFGVALHNAWIVQSKMVITYPNQGSRSALWTCHNGSLCVKTG
jgi:hypothetical protein